MKRSASRNGGGKDKWFTGLAEIGMGDKDNWFTEALATVKENCYIQYI